MVTVLIWFSPANADPKKGAKKHVLGPKTVCLGWIALWLRLSICGCWHAGAGSHLENRFPVTSHDSGCSHFSWKHVAASVLGLGMKVGSALFYVNLLLATANWARTTSEQQPVEYQPPMSLAPSPAVPSDTVESWLTDAPLVENVQSASCYFSQP